MKTYLCLVATLALVFSVGCDRQMLRSATSGSTSSTVSEVTPPPIHPPPVDPPSVTYINPNLGVNLEGITDYSRLYMFADLAKASRQWGSPSAPWDGSASVDAQGWPTQDAGVILELHEVDVGDTIAAYRYMAVGTYAFSFTGRATVSGNGIPVANSVYDAASNTTTGDLLVGERVSQMFLSFRNTSGGIKNLKVMRPGYAATGEIWTKEFLAAIAPFGTLRFMDALATNNNPLKLWSERTLPTSATQASSKGMAYEHVIDLANTTGKAIWINVPGSADDNYILQLATLLKNSLNPKINVYVEFSNEVWNTIFSQSSANEQAAVAEVIAGDTSLTGGHACTAAELASGTNNCNRTWAGWLRVGKRTVRITQIFAQVFGQSAINTRIRPILATHFAYLAIGEQQLKYIARYHGQPSTLIYGIAGAPYYDIENSVSNSPTLTLNQIFSSFAQSLSQTLPMFAAGVNVAGVFTKGAAYQGGDWTGASQLALAKFYNIKSLAYEGGSDYHQNTVSTAVKYQSNFDPRAGELTRQYIEQWLGCGNDLFMYFTLSSGYSQWGNWGLTNDPVNMTSPKMAAFRALASTPLTAFRTCQ